ncbi:MAG: LysR family transcriptional regulator [Lachnospiraceae bacterium]|nr:LysR family transcriptional regulator [Lachnospiraceae bacterium]
MRTENLREFLALAETGNYKTASELLYISQPTLSRHIKELEAELGVPLFKRTTRKTDLTDFGLLLLVPAREIVEVENNFIKSIASLQEMNKNTITIGCAPYTDSKFTEIISIYKETHPDAHIKTTWENTSSLRKELQSGNLNFLILCESPPYKLQQVERIRLYTVPMKIVLPKSHPLASRQEISIRELSNKTIMVAEDLKIAYRLVTKMASDNDTKLRIIFQGNQTQLLNLVQLGTGVALVFRDAEVKKYDNITTAVLTPRTCAEINCIYIPEFCFKKNCSDFIDFCKSLKDDQ